MTSQADKLKAKHERLQQQQQQQEDAESAPSTTPKAKAPRATKYRKTLDMYPARYNAFEEWLGETARELGRSKHGLSQIVLTAMVHRLLTDETFARKIRADLKQDQ